VSNVFLALVAIQGLLFLGRKHDFGPDSPFSEPWERQAFGVFFLALGMTAIGSAYFHLGPDPGTLFWDRLPMAVVFPSLLAIMIGERIDMRTGRILFLPLLAAGIGSVLYWRYMETTGAGDVRFYALIQFFPMAAIPAMVLLFPPLYTRTADLLGVLGWYALAKVAEVFDAAIFRANAVVSGHTIKHMASAAAAYWILRMLKRRRHMRA